MTGDACNQLTTISLSNSVPTACASQCFIITVMHVLETACYLQFCACATVCKMHGMNHILYDECKRKAWNGGIKLFVQWHKSLFCHLELHITRNSKLCNFWENNVNKLLVYLDFANAISCMAKAIHT